MNLTGYHAKYFAYELTKRCASDNLEKLAGALVDAQDELISGERSSLLKPRENCSSKLRSSTCSPFGGGWRDS